MSGLGPPDKGGPINNPANKTHGNRREEGIFAELTTRVAGRRTAASEIGPVAEPRQVMTVEEVDLITAGLRERKGEEQAGAPAR
ncbi:MAG: hypothetical protein J2P19_00160 [Pseudonocardia sp.]|nr:hypothetical protein [Pseudonocardia sp.]